MKIKVNGLSVNIILSSSKISKDKIPIIFLHGFTGSASDWEFIMRNINDNYFPIAIDLPGHGKSEISLEQNDYNIDAIINVMLSIFKKLNLNKVVLVGYSMGGRASLSFALNNQERVQALILESTTAGIKNSSERERRYLQDIALAQKIENEGIDKFIDYWMELSIFESLKNLPIKNYQKIIAKKKSNSEKGLSNSLRGFSTGEMESLWDRLNDLELPTFLICGSKDEKYTKINLELAKLIPRSKLRIVKDAGHNVHLEKPKEFIKLVNVFLNSLLEKS